MRAKICGLTEHARCTEYWDDKNVTDLDDVCKDIYFCSYNDNDCPYQKIAVLIVIVSTGDENNEN